MTSSAQLGTGTRARLRWQFSLRELLIVTAVVALYLSAYVVLLRGLSPSMALTVGGFVTAVLTGMVLSTFFTAYLRRRVAGDVIAQLQRTPASMYLVWLVMPIITHIAAAIGLFAPAQEEFPATRLIADSFQMFFLLLLVQSSYFTLFSWLNYPLTICRNGLVHLSGAFTPWKKVSAWRWRLEPDGRLLIGKRKLRPVGIVLPEDRNAVALVLGENMLPDRDA